jgi:vacuolar-type H+-ATPase subunit C/Vma6
VASALRRYAYAQARVRARLARLLAPAQLEALAAVSDPEALARELAALGWSDPRAVVLAAWADAWEWLEGPPREVIARERARFELENLKLLLRAVERRRPYAEVAPLLLPVGALAPGRDAEAVAAAPSLADAVDRLAPEPFGVLLRRHVQASADPASVERFRLEAAAERAVWEAIAAAVEALEPADRRAAARLVAVRIDVENLLRALRLRTQHGVAPEEVIAYAIRGGSFGAEARAVLAHEPVDTWSARLAATPYGRALADVERPWRIERALERIVVGEAERALRGSPFSIGIVLAWLVLLESQAGDVRRLVAGRRLQRDEGWIRAGLALRTGA